MYVDKYLSLPQTGVSEPYSSANISNSTDFPTVYYPNGTVYGNEYMYYYDTTYEEYYSHNATFNLSHCNIDWESILDKLPGYEICIHILLPIICAIGIVGIILTVIVLSRKTMSTSTNSYLISLAMSDLAFLLIMATRCIETKLSREIHYHYMLIMNYINIFLLSFLLASVWLTVMLAIERYIAICHPLRAMGICTVIRARIIIVLIFICSFLFRLPEFFKIKPYTFYDHCIDKEVPLTQPTDLAFNETFRHIYSWSDCFFLAVLPFSLLLFLNVCLIREIHRSTNYLRYHLASDSNVQTIITGEEIKITMMLISVVVVFFICEAPHVILVVMKRLRPDERFPNFQLMTNITILLLVLRSSFNFILYCWFSEKFWNTFKKTFCMPQCFLTHAPNWLRSRVWNNSDRGHSNNNLTAGGHGETRTTTTHYENGMILRSSYDNNHQTNDHINTNL
ncbi:FMRFamide receptor-like [Mercenaria mercenaria]|uniref:FMRFamide receptor-like n=1 Tax=Mercenaria mercenaria TaxID=6596 RepID=UPI001E1DD484|nr:FMRFamide receptor-like [Mercenaria mercenaria]XP_053377009.1 FMRFamide receptor-like [Mercenaria mercenaria]